MFYLTAAERTVLMSVAVVIMVGALLRYGCAGSPVMRSAIEKTSQSLCVDINTASVSELEKLPGVGMVTAQAIVDYRLAHGSFAGVQDITHVKGIGPKKYARLEPCIRVEACLE